MNEEYYYKYDNYDIPFVLEQLKNSNPDVEFRSDIGVIVTSKPLEELNIPDIWGYNLKEKLVPITHEEFLEDIKDIKNPFLTSKISKDMAIGFAKSLKKCNPNVEINLSYDEVNKTGKITSNVPLYELNFPRDISINIIYGLDKNGNIGIVAAPTHHYKFEKNSDGEYKCVKVFSRYFGNHTINNKNTNLVNNDNIVDQSIENEDVDYNRLIAAQNESARRLKIASINRTIDTEKNKKRISAILTGVFAAGVIVATKYSGIDIEQGIQTEFEAINSMEALKEYLGMITPAMYATIICSVLNFENFLKHKRKQKDAEQELNDMQNYNPTAFLDEVDRQTRRK